MKKVIQNLPLLLRSPFTLRLMLLEMLIADKKSSRK
ncbi:hypothetical protein SAMN05216516_101147 [Izhakiella capsodis]|uniref:Uncharacterized protein n=1 Tax=Izhakiella capsodis TaxID=1367852 RepID=A0A1I4UI86_9GAMM|nr:hypothetical protein SAMN05216516_101147 [Izhakiella capsodis]